MPGSTSSRNGLTTALPNPSGISGTPSSTQISSFPQAFLTGILQNYALKHIITIEKLSFELKYLDFKASDIR